MYQSKIRQFLPRDNMQGKTATEHVTGKTPDISEYCDFYFYDLVWYHPGLHPIFNDKVGPWADGYAFLTGLEVICVIGYKQNQAH